MCKYIMGLSYKKSVAVGEDKNGIYIFCRRSYTKIIFKSF